MHPLFHFLIFFMIIASCTAQRPTSVFEEITPFERVEKELQGNPNITWIGETQTDLRFQDFNSVEKTKLTRKWNRLTVQKMLLLPQSNGFVDYTGKHQTAFQNTLLDWMKEAACFTSHQLTSPVSADVRKLTLSSADTFYVVHSDGTKHLTTTHNALDPNDLLGIRVHQLVYWDQANNNFGSRPLSFTPVVASYSVDGDISSKESNLWFPVDQEVTPREAWKNDYVTYVVETRYPVSIAGPDAMTTTKGQVKVEKFMTTCRDDQSTELFSIMDTGSPLYSQERTDLFRDRVDTFMVMNPDTYEEEVKIVDAPFLWRHLNKIRLVNRWFWDSGNFRLSGEFVGWAPLEDQHNRDGKIVNSFPLFYRSAE